MGAFFSNVFEERLDFVSGLLNYCRGIFPGQTSSLQILPVTVERETGQRKFAFPHFVRNSIVALLETLCALISLAYNIIEI